MEKIRHTLEHVVGHRVTAAIPWQHNPRREIGVESDAIAWLERHQPWMSESSADDSPISDA